jgi:hypothetical protein
LVLTKADLAPPETLLELYGALGVPYVVTRGGDAYDDWDLDAIRARLERAGVLILDGEPIVGLRRFELRDPFGNRVELVEKI